jgi:hypothetical protein
MERDPLNIDISNFLPVPSERAHGLLEERYLLRRGRSVQRGVTVWKAAESIDDHLVRQGISRPFLVTKLFEKAERQRLVLAVLAMLERKVKKKPLLLVHGRVETLLNRLLGEPARDEVGCKGSWSAPKHVARKLIQDNYCGEQWAWSANTGTFLSRKLTVQCQETLANLRINVVASREPTIFCQLLEPEADDIADPGLFDIFGVRGVSGRPQSHLRTLCEYSVNAEPNNECIALSSGII